MATFLDSVTLGDLVRGKQALVEVGAQVPVGDVLRVLEEHKVLSVPVYTEESKWGQHPAPRASGGHLYIGSKQYVAVLSTLDLVSFVWRVSRAGLEFDDTLVGVALEAPCSKAFGSTLESLNMWIVNPAAETGRSVLERFAKGSHRALVPPTAPGEDARLLTQTDCIRYLAERRTTDAALDALYVRPLRDHPALDLLTKRAIVTVPADALLTAAVALMLRNIVSTINAVAVVDSESGRILSTLSVSDFRGTVAQELPAMHGLSVADFLRRQHPHLGADGLPTPLVCQPHDQLGAVINSMLGSKVHRAWFVDNHSIPISVVTFTDILRALVHTA